MSTSNGDQCSLLDGLVRTSIVLFLRRAEGGKVAGDHELGQAAELRALRTFGGMGNLATSIPHLQHWYQDSHIPRHPILGSTKIGPAWY